ncbi:hypothetical protein OH76DRAFT_510510 [Lentinus brumalis]|uniref:Uncharacterized protein n=1 Tax=Lentinus brumalis TaxID=2498619 RepID=A0A371DB56_9APHY|nr:hypothetical protein OH76DRAFT_510510 [Polyporus brumalis]
MPYNSANAGPDCCRSASHMAAYSMICWGTIQTQLQRRLLGLGSAVRLWAMAVCIATEFALEDLYADVAGANPVLAKSIAEAARWFSTKEGNVGMPLVCCKNSVMHMSGRPMHMHMQVRACSAAPLLAVAPGISISPIITGLHTLGSSRQTCVCDGG